MRKYNFKIDRNSKRIKVCENKEQGFRLVTITHCGYLYISLNHLRTSLNISNLSGLKKSLLKLSTNSLCNVMIINDTKAKIMPFVKDFILMRYLENKKNLCRSSKKQAFIEWFKNEVEQKSLSKNEIKELKEGIKILQETEQIIKDQIRENSLTNKELKPKEYKKYRKSYENIESINTNNQLNDEKNFINGDKITMVVDKKDITFEIENGQIVCSSTDLAKFFRRPHYNFYRDIRVILCELEKIKDEKFKSNFQSFSTETEGANKEIFKITKDGFVLLCVSKSLNHLLNGYLRTEIFKIYNSLEKYCKMIKEKNETNIISNSGETKIDGEYDINIFEKVELGKIRVKGDSENPLFCLSDVCKILELTTPAKIADMVKKEFELYELNSYSFNTGQGIKEMTMITEPQLYFVLMRSDKPKAKPFRQWVINEVLPQIRKQGKFECKEQEATQNTPPPLQKELISELLRQNNMLLQHILKTQ